MSFCDKVRRKNSRKGIIRNKAPEGTGYKRKKIKNKKDYVGQESPP
jgi:hypothetical protein